MADSAYDYSDLRRCEAHGWYRPFFHRGEELQCFACSNEARRFDEETRRYGPPEPHQREAVERERTEARLTECGLIGRYRSATFANFEAKTPAQREAVARCKAFVRQSTPTSSMGLLLIGPCGTGKSHLLAAIARDLKFERCIRARVTTPRAIIRRLRATWDKEADESESEVLDDLVRGTPVLLLDELGVGFGTDAELTQLFDVLDARYTLGLPTVGASNANLPALKATVGDRIFDRLIDGAEVVVLDWPSHRRLKA